MRKAVIERLTIILHLLARDSYTSFSICKVSKQLISIIIPEVCGALIEVLKKKVLKKNVKVKILTNIYLIF